MTREQHLEELGRVGILIAIMVVATIVGLTAQRVLSPLGQPPARTQSWANAVIECESHGGVAVVRATQVLGRSADLPACVSQLGE